MGVTLQVDVAHSAQPFVLALCRGDLVFSDVSATCLCDDLQLSLAEIEIASVHRYTCALVTLSALP